MIDELIVRLYDAFNKRNIDDVLAHFHPEIEWPNIFDGTYMKGHTAVREYWLKHWKDTDPMATPVHCSRLQNGNLDVEVILHITDLKGHVISNKLIRHLFILENDLIRRMEREP